MHAMQQLMQNLRTDAPTALAGYAVEGCVDYDTNGTGLPRANVLEYRLAGGHKLMVRPSGTEALIRVMAEAKTEAEARNCAQSLADTIKSLKF